MVTFFSWHAQLCGCKLRVGRALDATSTGVLPDLKMKGEWVRELRCKGKSLIIDDGIQLREPYVRVKEDKKERRSRD